MADNLQSVSIAAPGFFGLNTQESGASLPAGFALTADNCVIDKYGRIGSRKGWTAVNTANAGFDITSIIEYQKQDGTKEVLVTGNKSIYKVTGTTLTQIYTDAALTSSEFKPVQLDKYVVWFQLGTEPIQYDGTTVTKQSAVTGFAPNTTTGAAPKASVAVAAFGRLWVANTDTDKVTVYFSDLLTPHKWATGTAGSINLTTVFPSGVDEVNGVVAHNGFLVMLCRKCVIVYSGASTPSSMTLNDILVNVGCVAKNSVQLTGADLLFLSDKGLMSFGTLVQEKSLPQDDLSKNVRDDLLQCLQAETNLDGIKSVYYEKEAFYLLTMPISNITWCFDMRARLENGSARVTTWRSFVPKSYGVLRDRSLYIGFTGYIGKYGGYLDNNNTYRMSYYTNYFNFNDEAATTLKMLKRLHFVVIGGTGQSFISKWAFDYSDSFQAGVTTLPNSNIAEYGTAQYGISEFSTGVAMARIIQQASGTGSLVQIGIETVVNGVQLSIQKMDVMCKIGRTI